MKKVFFLILALAVCTLTNAQDSTKTHAKKQTTATTKPRKQSDMDQLNLSSDQQAKIKAVTKDYQAKTKKVNGNTALTDAQKKEKIKELKAEKKKEMDGILTVDQKNKLKEIHKEKKANSPQKTKTSPKTKTAG